MTVIAFLFHYYKHDNISFRLLKIFPIPKQGHSKETLIQLWQWISIVLMEIPLNSIGLQIKYMLNTGGFYRKPKPTENPTSGSWPTYVNYSQQK